MSDQVPRTYCEAYPGYEWVLTLAGSDWAAIGHATRLLEDAGLDGYCPGTSAMAGILARHEHAAEARRLLATDEFLRYRRCAAIEDHDGSHPFFTPPATA